MDETSQPKLCYLRAGNVLSPAGRLQGVTLESYTDEPLGTLDGVVIDPAERRLRYLVVQRRGWLRRGRCLLPIAGTMQMDREHGTLRVEVEPAQLDECPGFDPASIPEFSDDDVLTAMFAHRPYEQGAA